MKPAQVTAAVGLGYLLGRTKKMRLAVMIAAAGAISRVGSNPPQLLRKGYQEIADLPEVSGLAESVRGNLFGAAKSAAASVATNTVKSLNSRLQDQTGGGSAPEERREDADGTDDAEQEKPKPARRAAPKRTAAAAKSRTRATAERRTRK